MKIIHRRHGISKEMVDLENKRIFQKGERKGGREEKKGYKTNNPQTQMLLSLSRERLGACKIYLKKMKGYTTMPLPTKCV